MNAVSNADQASIDEQLERLPGQMFSPDDQCRYIHGPESYYCGVIVENIIIHGSENLRG